jgi:hypothetical protein
MLSNYRPYQLAGREDDQPDYRVIERSLEVYLFLDRIVVHRVGHVGRVAVNWILA